MKSRAMSLPNNLQTRSTLGLLLIAMIAVTSIGCGGDNSSFGKRKNLSDAGESDAGVDAPSNNITTDTGPGLDGGGDADGGLDPADTTETCVDTDEPDPSFEDANCDGIDGDREASVFVASYGEDTNDGTMGAPKKSIQAAIDAVSQDPAKSWVLVEAAMFEESFELSDGVHVVGGYGFGWKRAEGGPTLIRGGKTVVTGVDITTRTLVSDLEIEHDYTAAAGETVVGVYLERSGALELRNVKITGGTAGDGIDGTDGVRGSDGPDGGRGEDGDEDGTWPCGSSDRPARTSGPTTQCGGGAGGYGGRPGKGDSSGDSGGPGDAGASAGTGGGRKQPGGDGGDGSSGDNGLAGQGGDSTGAFSGTQWIGSAGGDGDDGAGGHGGGGGGGGGGAGGSFGDCSSYGGAGGSGGAGGCGGTAGTGGKPGGASVGLFLVDSADVTVVNCEIFGGTGGTGGAGGIGGAGGYGGTGKPGGNGEDGSGKGGTGGDGGDGGGGGAGGGGAGGPSFAIYTDVEFTSEPVDTTLEKGFGGQGGSSPSGAGRGENGSAHTVFVAAP